MGGGEVRDGGLEVRLLFYLHERLRFFLHCDGVF